VVPSYVGAFAFVSAFGPRGTLADLLAPLGVAEIPTIYGFGGTVLVLTLYVYPYVFLTTRAALLNFDGRLVEAARTLGHGRVSAFGRVTLSQIAPGVLAGALLVALYALSDFGTPAIMHLDVFTRQIYVDYNGGLRERAALLSLELLAVTAVILALESRLSAGDPGAHVSHEPGAADELRLGALKWPALALCVAVTALALVVPVGVLTNWLFRAGTATQAGVGFGFEFEAEYAFNSVYVSLLAAAAATLAALPVAHLATRHRSRLSRLFERATYVGYAVPGVVLGLALVYFGASYAGFLYQTIPLLVFAYVVRFLPQSVGAVGSSLVQVDPGLVEAARTLGHGSASTLRRVTLPLIAPGVVAGAALVFLTTMKELPATLLLHPTGFKTLVTYIWLVQSAGYYGRAALPALALVAISAVSMVVLLAQERYHD
jgi:iron(III) transport system permease protein